MPTLNVYCSECMKFMCTNIYSSYGITVPPCIHCLGKNRKVDYEEGYEQGYEEGYEKGHGEGYEEGLAEALAE